jgi:hypothetical protein
MNEKNPLSKFTFNFGKHKHETFQDVLFHDVKYINFIFLCSDVNDTSTFFHFKNYIYEIAGEYGNEINNLLKNVKIEERKDLKINDDIFIKDDCLFIYNKKINLYYETSTSKVYYDEFQIAYCIKQAYIYSKYPFNEMDYCIYCDYIEGNTKGMKNKCLVCKTLTDHEFKRRDMLLNAYKKL